MAPRRCTAGVIAILVRLLGDDAVPVSPVWGALNAVLNGMTLIAVAYIARRGR